MRGEQSPHRVSDPGRPLSEQLIERGIAAADREHRAIDHVTARRLAISLSARPLAPAFAEGLSRFIASGAIGRDLKRQLRLHSRSAGPHQPVAEKLMAYAISRGDDLGPVDRRFGAICDQLDQAEVMLATAVERARQGLGPQLEWPDREGPPAVVFARRTPETELVTLVMDPTTANIAMHAISAMASDREAHGREVERVGETLPPGSYGRANREAIAAREARVAGRLRAIQRVYCQATREVVVLAPPEPTMPWRPAASKEGTAEIELEAE